MTYTPPAGLFLQALNEHMLLIKQRGTPATPRELLRLQSIAQTEAAKGDIEAMYWLGINQFWGTEGLIKDEDAALKMLHSAIAAGHINAMTTVADIYSRKERYGEALQLYNKAAQAGDLYAKCCVAEMSYNGKGCEAEPKKAMELLNGLVADGYALAALKAGHLVLNETNDPRNKWKALSFFQRGLDIFDHAREELWVQENLYFQTGIILAETFDMPRGKSLIKRAAIMGNSDAKLWLFQNEAYPPHKFFASATTLFDFITQTNPAAMPSCVSYIPHTLKPDELIKNAIGWHKAKESYDSLTKLAELYKNLKELDDTPELHFSITGPKGTGRHYFTQIMARKLHDIGYIKHGHVVTLDLADIITRDRRTWSMWPHAQWLGASDPKAKSTLFMNVFEEAALLAEGGLLMICDSRHQDISEIPAETIAYEQQIINQLQELLRERRMHRFLVCLCLDHIPSSNDQNNETQPRLLRKNPSLTCQFLTHIAFVAFESSELSTLYRSTIKQRGLYVPDDINENIDIIFKSLCAEAHEDRSNNILVKKAVFESLHKKAINTPDNLSLTVDDLPSVKKKERPDDKAVAALLQPLYALTGMENIRNEIEQLVYFLRAQEEHKLSAPAPHFIFTGPPGTGKTSVARLLGKILHGLGYLSKGHVVETDGTSLIGKYIGSTPALMREKIEQAEGGILFIDEAYTLGQNALDSYQDKFREEAIAVLLKMMEDRRGKFIVIAAGYSKEMIDFVEANSGLKSRFTHYIDFESFRPEQLAKIFENLAHQGKYELAPDVLEKIHTYVAGLRTTDQITAFGNARGIRTMYEKAIARQSRRITQEGLWGKPEQNLIIAEDLALVRSPRVVATSEADIRTLLGPVDNLIGLNDVKKQLEKLVYLSQAQIMRSKDGMPRAPIMLHSIFSGPPGTGKTTVARLLGTILADLGYLSKGHVVEVAKNSMVGQWMGHTPKIVEQKVNLAHGGILFVDEAYALDDSLNGRGYGQEALTTLLKFMEDRRDDFIVIAAGYKKEMDEFLKTNSGLKSRFPFALEFKPYNSTQLLQIMDKICAELNYELRDDARAFLLGNLEKMEKEKIDRLGNGRLMRNIFEASIATQAQRVIHTGVSGKDLSLLTAADIIFPRDEEDDKKMGFIINQTST